jgi:hypothetical protein
MVELHGIFKDPVIQSVNSNAPDCMDMLLVVAMAQFTAAIHPVRALQFTAALTAAILGLNTQFQLLLACRMDGIITKLQ